MSILIGLERFIILFIYFLVVQFKAEAKRCHQIKVSVDFDLIKKEKHRRNHFIGYAQLQHLLEMNSKSTLIEIYIITKERSSILS